MICIKCGGLMIERNDEYTYEAPFIGNIILNGFGYIQCDSKSCDNTYFTEEMSRQIDIESKRTLNEILRSYPLDKFMTANHAREKFDISERTLDSSKKLFRIELEGTQFYFEKSLARYAKCGDGRFDINTFKE